MYVMARGRNLEEEAVELIQTDEDEMRGQCLDVALCKASLSEATTMAGGEGTKATTMAGSEGSAAAMGVSGKDFLKAMEITSSFAMIRV